MLTTIKEDKLQFARNCFEKVKHVDYPNGFSIAPWWKNIQNRITDAITSFATCEEAILYAQCGDNSGFDHRYPSRDMKSIIDLKINELERLFPGFYFGEHGDLKESVYSDKMSLQEVGGIQYSNIFLTHVNEYLRSTSVFDSQSNLRRVIEIGGGYGGLARVFKIMNPGLSYTIVDLPESLFFAQVFLSLNFPNAKIHYLNENENIDPDEFDFVLIPVQFCRAVKDGKYDICINSGSLQEMTDIAVNFWMNFIQTLIQVKIFYSFNYFLNNKRKYAETSYNEGNLICPKLDPFWKLKYFKINPEAVTIDASGRNWLEICVERVPAEKRDIRTAGENANALFQRSKLHPRGSNEWFQYVWMAIWYDRDNKGLKTEMLKGIRNFKLGLGAKNNLNCRMSLYPPADSSYNFIKRFIKHCIKRGINVLWRNFSYGEYQYYKNL